MVGAGALAAPIQDSYKKLTEKVVPSTYTRTQRETEREDDSLKLGQNTF
jgi:hypothetical protein